MESFRDAVMLLGRRRPYRELPRKWCAAQLAQSFELLRGRVFARRWTEEKVLRNLDWASEAASEVVHVGSKRDM